MKYMVVWSVSEATDNAAKKRFMENPPEIPGGVSLLGRWHEMGTGKGFSLYETDDPIALTTYNLGWTDLVNQKITPVVEDEDMGKALSG